MPVQREHSLGDIFHIPVDPCQYNCCGAVFTGKQQILWMGQLAEKAYQFAVHGW